MTGIHRSDEAAIRTHYMESVHARRSRRPLADIIAESTQRHTAGESWRINCFDPLYGEYHDVDWALQTRAVEHAVISTKSPRHGNLHCLGGGGMMIGERLVFGIAVSAQLRGSWLVSLPIMAWPTTVSLSPSSSGAEWRIL